MTLLTILLDAAAESSADSDYLGRMLAAAALLGSGGGWVKLLTDKATMKQEIIGLKEKLLEATSSKKALKKELEEKIDKADSSLKEDIEKKDQVLHGRIDRVRDENLKNYEKLEKKMDELNNKYDANTQKILDSLGNKK